MSLNIRWRELLTYLNNQITNMSERTVITLRNFVRCIWNISDIATLTLIITILLYLLSNQIDSCRNTYARRSLAEALREEIRLNQVVAEHFEERFSVLTTSDSMFNERFSTKIIEEAIRDERFGNQEFEFQSVNGTMSRTTIKTSLYNMYRIESTSNDILDNVIPQIAFPDSTYSGLVRVKAGNYNIFRGYTKQYENNRISMIETLDNEYVNKEMGTIYGGFCQLMIGDLH